MGHGRLAPIAVCCLAAASLAAPATAAGPKSPSKLAFTGFTGEPQFLFTGEVGSPSSKCLKGRKVVFTDDGTKLTTTKTSQGGAFEVGVGDLGPTVEDGFSAKLKPRGVGPKGNRRLCKSDTAEVREASYGVQFASFDLEVPTTFEFGGALVSERPECTAGRDLTLRISDGFEEPTPIGPGATSDGSGEFLVGSFGFDPGFFDAVVTDTDAQLIPDDETGDLIIATCLPTGAGDDSSDVEVQYDQSPSLSIVYNGDPGEFFGTLSSSEPACENARTITFLDNDNATATPTTDSVGFWRVDGFGEPGHSYQVVATTPSEAFGSSSPYILCQAAQSDAVVF